MADTVTSGIKSIYTGRDGLKKTQVYTATKITPTTLPSGNKTYKVEIVQYDNRKGEGGRVIGTKDGNKISWNDNASNEIKEDEKVINRINKESRHQASTIENQLATTSADKSAFNKANGNGNKGNEADNNQDPPKMSNLNSAASTLNAFFKKNKINLTVGKNYFPITKDKVSKLNVNFSSSFGRHLEYYTGMVFKITINSHSRKIQVNGGRYDNLISDLGSSKKIPAVGGAISLND